MINSLRNNITRIFTILFVAVSTLGMFAKDFVVVIDPGHGGKDHGALGIYAKEKNINLSVATKLGEMITSSMNDVKVIYTRNNDTFLTLQERANVANKAGGDLFISIHTNSIDKKARNRTTIKGASCYTLGLHKTDDNLAVAIRENSVMELEDDYTTTYKGFDPSSSESYIIFEINQSKHIDQSVRFASSIQNEFVNVAGRQDKGVRQAGFWVLAATSMPSVLVELDFICNPTQEDFLSSDDGQQKMAKSIFNAFKEYKQGNDIRLAMLNIEENGTSSSTEKDKTEGRKIYVKPSYSYEEKDVPEESYKYSVRRNERNKGRNRSASANKVETRSASANKLEPRSELANKVETRSESANKIAEIEVNEKKDKNDSQEIIYKIQILTSSTKIPGYSKQFKGLKNIDSYFDKGIYKYTYGETKSLTVAKKYLQEAKLKFPKAFIVNFKDGKRIK